MKRLLTLSTLLLLSIVTFAKTEIDGICYEFSGTEATVASGTKYTGSVTIPASVSSGGKNYKVTSIGDDAFYWCSGLTSVTIPNSVTSIGSDAFYKCSGLTSITIPNSVTSIGGGAFDGTAWYGNQLDGLVYAGKVAYKYKGTMPENTSVTIKNGTLGIANEAFKNCSGLTSITIPNSVTRIGSDAFQNCSGLTSITIPNSVTSIGSSAFYGCSGLTSVTIPNSVTSIGFYAFDGCSGLTSIYSYIEEPASVIGSNFDSLNYNKATLYVPYGTKDKYLATYGWKYFANIVEMSDPSAINGVNAKDAESFVGKIIKDNKIIIMKHGKKHAVSGQGM